MVKRYGTGVTLLGGGHWTAAELSLGLSLAPTLVCADGAANRLADEGPEPDLIVGDLDSLDDVPSWKAQLGDRLFHVTEQDSTDFEKCLRHVDAPFFIAVGFLGGRLDHELSMLSALVAERRTVIALGALDLIFAAHTHTRFPTRAAQRVSVYPMMPVSGRSSGLKWPIDGLSLAPGGQLATSNEATGQTVGMTFDRPGALIILPAEDLVTVLPYVIRRGEN